MSTSLAERNGNKRDGYLGIAGRLRRQIAGGGLPAGVQLPPIATLSAEWGATPITVRRALRHLEEEGLIRVEHGVGTFVADWAAGHDLLPSFSEALSSHSQLPETVVLAREHPVTNPAAAAALGLENDVGLVRLIRLRRAGGRPLALQHSYLAGNFSKLMETYDSARSLYEWLREASGQLPVSASETLRCVALKKKMARLLDSDPGSPAWHSTRLTTDANGQPLLYDEAWLPGSRVELQLTKTPGHSTASLAIRSDQP